MIIAVAIVLTIVAIVLFILWRIGKISNPTLYAMAAIATVVAGIAAIVLSILPPQPPQPSGTDSTPSVVSMAIVLKSATQTVSALGTFQVAIDTIPPSNSPAITNSPASISIMTEVTPQPTGLQAQITDAKGIKMALVPTGEFQMGGEIGNDFDKKVHSVSLDAFYMDMYEVTNARYAKCVSSGACQPPTQNKSPTRDSYYGNSQYADYPVIYVTWEMAKAYCEWRGGRLPSEAQWEKAARGGLQGMEYPWGNEKPVCEKGAQNGAKFDDDAGCNATDTEPVGSFSPNGYGLFDMAGNVSEWVWDWYSDSYYSRQTSFVNPFGPDSGNFRVVRGSSWNNDSYNLRVALRYWYNPSSNDYNLGFRCSRSP